jgi:hypothetical protein
MKTVILGDITRSAPTPYRGAAQPSKHHTIRNVQPEALKGTGRTSEGGMGAAAGKLTHHRDKCCGIETC